MAQKETLINQLIATASMKDGSAMKAIAILTMCFLPGTFVAVSAMAACCGIDTTITSMLTCLADLVRYASHALRHLSGQPCVGSWFRDVLGGDNPAHCLCPAALGGLDVSRKTAAKSIARSLVANKSEHLRASSALVEDQSIAHAYRRADSQILLDGSLCTPATDCSQPVVQ